MCDRAAPIGLASMAADGASLVPAASENCDQEHVKGIQAMSAPGCGPPPYPPAQPALALFPQG